MTQTFTSFFQASFKMIYRNKQAVYFSLILPVFIILIFGLVAGDARVGNGMLFRDFVVPGLVAMTVLQLAVFSVAFVIAQYKEKGVLKKLVTTPVSPQVFLGGQIAARLVITVVQVMLLFSVAILALDFVVRGSFLLLILIGLLGSLVFLALGFVIAGLAKKVESVPAIANIIVFPMLFLGDVFFPVDSLPSWLEPAARVLPIQYLAHALREVALNGSNWWSVRGDLIGLVVWLLIFFYLAQRVFALGVRE